MITLLRHLASRYLYQVPLLGLILLGLARLGRFQRCENYARGAVARKQFSEAGMGLQIGRNVVVRMPSSIRLGSNVTLHDGVFLHGGALINIGSNSHIDVYSSVYGHGGVTIGCNCAIAAGVRIYSQSNTHGMGIEVPITEQPREYALVSIGDDVWIGANAVIFPGVRIGDHSVVGAGAVVNRDVARATVVGGVPARILSRRE